VVKIIGSNIDFDDKTNRLMVLTLDYEQKYNDSGDK
jgi:hypothetical protein